jgi:hypothetical protein
MGKEGVLACCSRRHGSSSEGRRQGLVHRSWYGCPWRRQPCSWYEDGPEGATQRLGIAAHEDVGAGAGDDGQATSAGMLLESAMLIALSLANRSSKYAWSGTQGPTRGRGAAVSRSYCVTLV